MIESSQAYRAAIVGDVRRMYIDATIDIISPDIVYGTPVCSGERPDVSRLEQLHDKEFETTANYASTEHNRWLLGGKVKILPRDPMKLGQSGFVSDELSGTNGKFARPQYAEIHFSNVSILQACKVYFSDAVLDGIAVDFTVEVMEGGTVRHTQNFTDNKSISVSVTGFTVYYPDAIRVTVTRWSLPSRYARIAEIVPGLYEKWDGNTIASLEIKQQCDVSCMKIPYSTAILSIDNQDRKFESRNKAGIFKSIEERQGIPIRIGPRLPDGSIEYKPVGVFYQYSGGWKTGDNNLTITWYLADIIGLLVNREFVVPEVLPETLEGWIAALVAQLGENFACRYHVDPDYAQLPVTALSADDLKGLTCGSILCYVCMATGTWPRADAETGYLTAEPLWSEGNTLTLDNLNECPTMKANDDIAAIFFTLSDGEKTQCTISGTSVSSSETKSVKNPFIHTKEQALAAARQILSTYGGNKLETVGRGDPSSELGDVDTVWLDKSNATTARRIQQTFSFSDGVLQDCGSVFLQADGCFMFVERAVITQSGFWTSPPGVGKLFVIISGGGDGGGNGKDGTSGTDLGAGKRGADGENGRGAKVWYGTININEQQSFYVNIGLGGDPGGGKGQDTTFGAYSSANGRVYSDGYTDIQSGDSFARTGVPEPLPNTGDGGAGGKGGAAGMTHTELSLNPTPGAIAKWVTVVDYPSGKGEKGAPGASGCVIVYWDKEAGQ